MEIKELTNKATKCYYKNNLKEALSLFLQALSLDINNSYSYYNLGLTYDALKEYELAIANYKKAIALNPYDVRSVNNVAWIYFENIKDEDTATKYLNYAIQIMPNDAEAYNIYGNIYFKKEDFKTAILYFKKAIKFDKNYAKNYYDISKAYIGIEDFKNAKKTIETCIQINSNYPLAKDLLVEIEKFI